MTISCWPSIRSNRTPKPRRACWRRRIWRADCGRRRADRPPPALRGTRGHVGRCQGARGTAVQAGWMRGARTLDAIDLAAHLTHDDARDLARLAPDTLRVPSGRTARLEYQEDGSVSAAVKLQELFGLAETPRIGPRQSRSCCICSRRTAGRCRRRATCGASGTAPTPRCARSCAAATRSIPGPRIPGPRRRPTAPSRGGDGAGTASDVRRGTLHAALSDDVGEGDAALMPSGLRGG